MTPLPQTGPLPDFEQPAANSRERDAFMLLDNLWDLRASKNLMLHELEYNFGYTEQQAEIVYRQWATLKEAR